MKDFWVMCAVGLTIIGGLSIGAYLALHGHPWFALLAMLIVASIQVKTD